MWRYGSGNTSLISRLPPKFEAAPVRLLRVIGRANARLTGLSSIPQPVPSSETSRTSVYSPFRTSPRFAKMRPSKPEMACEKCEKNRPQRQL